MAIARAEQAEHMFESILCQVTGYDPDVLTSLIELAVEIAREGREGRRIGTLFTLGDEQAVLALLERGVWVHPGYFFGLPESGWLVVSLLGREEEFDGGMVTVTDYFRTNQGGKI